MHDGRGLFVGYFSSFQSSVPLLFLYPHTHRLESVFFCLLIFYREKKLTYLNRSVCMTREKRYIWKMGLHSQDFYYVLSWMLKGVVQKRTHIMLCCGNIAIEKRNWMKSWRWLIKEIEVVDDGTGLFKKHIKWPLCQWWLQYELLMQKVEIFVQIIT